jgi:hypothetical protein
MENIDLQIPGASGYGQQLNPSSENPLDAGKKL